MKKDRMKVFEDKKMLELDAIDGSSLIIANGKVFRRNRKGRVVDAMILVGQYGNYYVAHKGTHISVANLIYRKFVTRDYPPGCTVRFHDGNPLNVKSDNLYLRKSPASKLFFLREEDVVWLRDIGIFQSTTMGLSDMFGITFMALKDIIIGVRFPDWGGYILSEEEYCYYITGFTVKQSGRGI